MTTHAYIVIADDKFVRVCTTSTDAGRERRDLMDMGCVVTIRRVSWADHDAAITVLGSHA